MIASRILSQLAALRRDVGGTMVIETAIVAPVLVVLSVGAFEASSMVSRQSELQSAAAEAVAIVMAATPKTQTQLDQIEAVIEKSSGLSDADVDLALKIRCGTDEDLIDKDDLTANSALCGNADLQSWFIWISMTDRYQPVWTNFGLGSGLDYNVQRLVQMS